MKFEKLKANNPNIDNIYIDNGFNESEVHARVTLRIIDDISYEINISSIQNGGVSFAHRTRSGGVLVFGPKIQNMGYFGTVFMNLNYPSERYLGEYNNGCKIYSDDMGRIDIGAISFYIEHAIEDSQDGNFIGEGILYLEDKIMIPGVNMYYDGSFTRHRFRETNRDEDGIGFQVRKISCSEPCKNYDVITDDKRFMYYGTMNDSGITNVDAHDFMPYRYCRLYSDGNYMVHDDEDDDDQ